MSSLSRAVALVASAVLTVVLAVVLGAVVPAAPAGATIPRGDTVDSDPDPSWERRNWVGLKDYVEAHRTGSV